MNIVVGVLLGEKMTHELYKKMIKEDMENMTQTGQIPKDQIVEIALEKLSVIDNTIINDAIEKYRGSKKELMDKADELNKQIVKLVDDYYTQILKDL